MQDFQKQLNALNQLKGFLEGYRSDLGNQLGTYRSWVQNMRHEGVETRIAGAYENNYYAENDKSIQRVIDNIDEKDLPFIRRQIEAIEDILRRLGS